MTTRAPFLNAPYAAYHHRELPAEDEELTHVGPGTPCGEYLRRFWQPVACSEQLKDLPLRIRILGEDLVVFRDQSGRTGLMELHCPHRGTSLEFGLISELGIRCCYHGWLFDVDGRILETPGEPADSTLKDRLCHGAYPVQEYGGMVFAYMGPPEKRPVFPIYDSFLLPGYVVKPQPVHYYPCSWLQIKDNAMDPAHLNFLHTIDGNVGFSTDLQLSSQIEWMETPGGMLFTSTRRIGDNIWVRITDFFHCNAHQFAASDYGGDEVRYGLPDTFRWTVPIDDTNSVIFGFNIFPEARKDEPTFLYLGQTDERPYEERQRVPGDYDAQSSQRPIAVHALEHLATTDRGIIMLRNIIRQGIRAVADGEDPPGITRKDGEILPTYCGDTVLRLPAAPTPEEDEQLLRRTARKVAQDYIETPPAIRHFSK